LTPIVKKYPREYEIIKSVVGKCDEIVDCNYNALSWAAKVHFVLEKNHKSMNYQEAIAACRPFGWKLGTKEIDTAAQLLRELRLIAT
jgi:hypothetical protein